MVRQRGIGRDPYIIIRTRRSVSTEKVELTRDGKTSHLFPPKASEMGFQQPVKTFDIFPLSQVLVDSPKLVISTEGPLSI